jgi:hypothetical protein
MPDPKSRRRHSWLHVFSAYTHHPGVPESLAREYAVMIDDALHAQWELGHNLILHWSSAPYGLDLLVIRHYQLVEVAEHQAAAHAEWIAREVVRGEKRVEPDMLRRKAERFGVEPVRIELPFDPAKLLNPELISALVRRYSVSLVQDRAVALFDAVGFSLLSPLEQVSQLNSLAYSVNSAYAKLLDEAIEIAFARTTTGDGFYIWNRNASIRGNVDLYHFVQLILADNAISRSKATASSTPLLRACFHVGSHYEFYQEEGLSPTTFSYLVGDVTIELARMIDKALPGQILVGDFNVPMHQADGRTSERIDSIEFIERTRRSLSDLDGVELSGHTLESIQCYLTGPQHEDGSFGINRYRITDKHGLTHKVYNAKVNIHRREREPIFLGVQESEMGLFDGERIEEIYRR